MTRSEVEELASMIELAFDEGDAEAAGAAAALVRMRADASPDAEWVDVAHLLESAATAAIDSIAQRLRGDCESALDSAACVEHFLHYARRESEYYCA